MIEFSEVRRFAYIFASVLELTGAVIGGLLLGYFIDSKIKTQGIFTGTGAFVGFVLGLFVFIRILTEGLKQNKQ